MPARSRIRSTVREARRAGERLDRVGLALAVLEREERRRRLRTSRRITARPSSSPKSASGGSQRATSGISDAPASTYGGFETTASASRPASRSPSHERRRRARAASAFARATSSASRAHVGREDLAGPAARPSTPARPRPSPVPTSTTRAPVGQAQRRLDEVLGLRPRDQHAPVDVQLDVPEALGAEDVGDRLALAAAPDGVHERARRVARPARGRESANSIARSTPSAAASSSSASSRGVVAARGGQRDAGGVERVADRRPRDRGGSTFRLLLEPAALLRVLQRRGELVRLARRAPARGCGR